MYTREGQIALRESDGLSGDYINKLFEDREGNIWVATLNGLDRFRELRRPHDFREPGFV